MLRTVKEMRTSLPRSDRVVLPLVHNNVQRCTYVHPFVVLKAAKTVTVLFFLQLLTGYPLTNYN
jgi:hypothetical protein